MKISVQYSNNWETMEKEDDINQYFWYCYKANSFKIIKSLIQRNGSVYLAQLLQLMLIRLFKAVT